ncbi:CBS domain-containing protein [Methanogenium sp. S4BF]|uniref:CBS domain-containing protein n=1 Tax=Methanogenium sp. S4BF TaxID=1789226 RepID=UPI002417AFC4|nr:CBS domain-containing protein [Methanogenium sp. S4BF]WFN34175.1 CBS domain-containing protein [Methanogenium sp. S4BF]
MSPEDQSRPITIASCVRITTLMTKDLVCVSPETVAATAAASMAERLCGSCLVMADGALRGVITEQDLTRKVVAAGKDPGTTPVSAIMSSPVVTLGSEGTVGEAADLMIRHTVRRIVVEEEGIPVGIVTARDVLGFASDMNAILQDLSGMYGTMMFLDPDMHVLWVNRQPEDAEVTYVSGPVHCYEFLHGNATPCHGCPLTLSGTAPERTVRTSEIVDNERRIWQVQCHPVSWGDGKVLGVIESAIEVTRERELEQALREHRNHLHMAVEGADIETWYCRSGPGGMVIGSDGGVLFAPDTRFSGTEDMFRYLQMRMHPDDLPVFRGMVESLLSGSEPVGEGRFRMSVPGGGWRWIRTMCGVGDIAPDGTAEAIGGVNIDITDLTNYRAAIQRASRKLNLLASVTRHDVLNQVSAIMLAGELLELDGYLDKDSGLAETIGRMISSAETIGRQILFTKEYQGLGEADPEWQAVCPLAGSAARELGSGAGTLTLSCECEGLKVYADPMFGHVIFNLIDNAIRHGDGTTTVSIGFMDSRDGGILTLEDDGCGVPAELKEVIFSRGYGKNTGFGLFLSREILEITGISIRECGEPGDGARFEMLIPHSGYRVV